MSKKILYLPEMDYLVSLETYFFAKEKKENEYELDTEDGSLIWEDYLSNPDLYFVYHDAQMIFKSRTFSFFINHFVLEHSIDELITLSANELYSMVLDYREISEKKREYREIVYAEFERFINDSYMASKEDLIVMKEVIFNTESFKARLNDVLKTTYKIFTEKIYTKEAEELIEKVLARFQDQLDRDEKAFSDSLTIFSGSEYNQIPEELTLCMLYYASQEYFIMLKDMLVLFGREIPKYVKHFSEDSRMEIFLKALSNPTCYKMIKLLSKTPFYGAEIAREIGIPTSELEKHIEHVQRARLLTAMEREKNRIYFEINKDELEKRLEELKNDLLT